jgi:hypothetical protein
MPIEIGPRCFDIVSMAGKTVASDAVVDSFFFNGGDGASNESISSNKESRF